MADPDKSPTSAPTGPAGEVRRSVDVAAPAERVWALVSDLPGMGAFSPESRGGRWISGGGVVTGVGDCRAFTATSIEQTLEAIQRRAGQDLAL